MTGSNLKGKSVDPCLPKAIRRKVTSVYRYADGVRLSVHENIYWQNQEDTIRLLTGDLNPFLSAVASDSALLFKVSDQCFGGCEKERLTGITVFVIVDLGHVIVHCN